jgi:hypothetical protein
MLMFKTLKSGTQIADRDGFTVYVWQNGEKANWAVRRNSDGAVMGRRCNYPCTIERARIDAIDCWREHAHPATKQCIEDYWARSKKREVI